MKRPFLADINVSLAPLAISIVTFDRRFEQFQLARCSILS